MAGPSGQARSRRSSRVCASGMKMPCSRGVALAGSRASAARLAARRAATYTHERHGVGRCASAWRTAWRGRPAPAPASRRRAGAVRRAAGPTQLLVEALDGARPSAARRPHGRSRRRAATCRNSEVVRRRGRAGRARPCRAVRCRFRRWHPATSSTRSPALDADAARRDAAPRRPPPRRRSRSRSAGSTRRRPGPTARCAFGARSPRMRRASHTGCDAQDGARRGPSAPASRSAPRPARQAAVDRLIDDGVGRHRARARPRPPRQTSRWRCPRPGCSATSSPSSGAARSAASIRRLLRRTGRPPVGSPMISVPSSRRVQRRPGRTRNATSPVPSARRGPTASKAAQPVW